MHTWGKSLKDLPVEAVKNDEVHGSQSLQRAVELGMIESLPAASRQATAAKRNALQGTCFNLNQASPE